MARTARIKKAFVASTELRPMAQQLSTMRTPAAYSGVSAWAHRQTGDAAAAGYLAVGHAYLIDKRYSDAAANLRLVRQNSEVLSDYADFLAAEAEHDQGNEAAAEALLKGFNDRHADSIFDIEAPELEANVLLAQGNVTGAQHVLASIADEAGDLPNYELTQAKILFALGRQQDAIDEYKHLLLSHPLSPEAGLARAKLTAMGAESNLTAAELRSLGDAFYNGGRYAEAGEQYHALARNATLPASERNGFAVAAASCDLKLKRLTETQAQTLADTQDENGARRLYLLMELARNRNDEAGLLRIVDRLKTDFPQSPWLAEALFSTGNMYLLRKDFANAANLLRLSRNSFSIAQECRGGSLARRLAELSPGTLQRRLAHVRRADQAFPQRDGNRGRHVLARAPLRDAGEQPRPGRAELSHGFAGLPTLLLCADVTPALAGSRRAAARLRFTSGDDQSRCRFRIWRIHSPPTARISPKPGWLRMPA